LTSFYAIQHYSPVLVLAAGLSMFLGLWGTGQIILFCCRLRFPSPWNHVASILLGVQALSLSIQIAGMAEMASRSMLTATWWALAAIGIAVLLLRAGMTFRSRRPTRAALPLLLVAIAGPALAIDLLVALAPSTKIDELYYHLLVPSRIVSDGALRFYREPWDAAIWPHMLYQISSTPAHAVGYPDAANVVSWGLGTTVVWFAWRVIRSSAKPAAWAALWAGSLCVGIYPAVWRVTGGAHAMGDLATAAAIVAFCSRERMLGILPPPAYAALTSILLLSASTSKISLLPLSAVLLCLTAWPLLRLAPPSVGMRVAFALAAPWIVFLCPIALWTWVQSGSPFGPVFAGAFGPSIYPDGLSQDIFRSGDDAYQPPVISEFWTTAVGYSPLVSLAVIGAIFGTTLSTTTRLALGCLLVLQCAVVYWFFHYAARFLGGLHYGLVIVFAAFATPGIQSLLASARSVAVAYALFLLPWLGVQAYYAKQFFRVALGLETTAFYERTIAFYADYVELDRLLSKDTVLLAQGFRLSAAYAPRPIFLDPADLPRDKKVALFTSPQALRAAALGRYKLGDLIYENPHAVIATFRTPGTAPTVGPLQVIGLVRE
jgi:hypothetical protein